MKTSTLILVAIAGGAAYLYRDRLAGLKDAIVGKLTPAGTVQPDPADGAPGAAAVEPALKGLDEGAPYFQNAITERPAAGGYPRQVLTRRQAVLMGL